MRAPNGVGTESSPPWCNICSVLGVPFPRMTFPLALMNQNCSKTGKESSRRLIESSPFVPLPAHRPAGPSTKPGSNEAPKTSEISARPSSQFPSLSISVTPPRSKGKSVVITKHLQEEAFLTVYCESCLSNFYPFLFILCFLSPPFFFRITGGSERANKEWHQVRDKEGSGSLKISLP